MGDRTPIIVAVIGLAGTITVGLLANADKVSAFFGPRTVHDEPGNTLIATPPGNAIALPGSTIEQNEHPDPAVSGNAGADQPPATAVSNTTDPAVTPPPAAEPVEIAGLWISDDGYSFTFSQSGASFSYIAKQKGADKGSGNGTIAGSLLRYGFTSPDGDGGCTATVADDANSMLGSCHMNDQAWKTWPVEIKRLRIDARQGALTFHHP